MTRRRINRPYLFGIERRFVVTGTLFVLLAILSCRNESITIPQQNRPALERASVSYMLPTVNAAYKEILNAEQMLSGDPPDVEVAKKSLGKTRRSLAILREFYLPATDARENVYNAYLEHLSGHPEERDTYLESARRGLLQIAERSRPRGESYIKELADRIETVQFRIRDGEPVRDELNSLCELFQLHLLKAQLALDANAFEDQG